MKPILRKMLFPPEPAIPAAYALSLLGWSAGMVLFFSVPVFYLFFSFCAIGGETSYFSMGLWLASLGIETLLAVYALWAVNRFYYRQLASPRTFAACWLAALVGATMLTWCDNSSDSPIFAAMIPTYLRRELWLEGKFIPVILLTPLLAGSVLLPCLTGWCKQHLIATIAATLLSIIAVGFGILGLGMFGNYFKYFSLGAISDFHSPVWEVPQAVEISLLLSFGAALAATGFRLYFWRAIAGDELRHRLPSILRRSTLAAGILFLTATVYAIMLGACFRQTEIPARSLPEALLQQPVSESTLCMVSRLSPTFKWHFETRLPLVPDSANGAMLNHVIAAQPELLNAIDEFCRIQPQPLPFNEKSDPAINMLIRLVRIQAIRQTAAHYRCDPAESFRVYMLLTNVIKYQTQYHAFFNPQSAFTLDLEWLNRTEQMLNERSFSDSERAVVRAFAAAAPERLARQQELACQGWRRQAAAEWQQLGAIVPLLSSKNGLYQFNHPLLLIPREAMYRLYVSFLPKLRKQADDVAEKYQALLMALEIAPETPVREGKITRQVFEIPDNDFTSRKIRPIDQPQSCRYRQFGTGENSIILIEKNEAQNPSPKSQ